MKNSRNTNSKVWFITGTSQGFGKELVRAALARGDSVVATSRYPEKVAADFLNAGERLFATTLDLTDSKQITETVASVLQRFGRIDVLINNAGHGMLGAVEEVSDEEIRRVYEINVFGFLRITRAILPHFRQQRSGHIVNLSSMGGLVGFPGWGIYCSTKFAVEGISESLASELNPLGIGVTVVEPGPFRTDFLGNSLAVAEKEIADYESTAGQTRNAAPKRNQNQPGSPELAAAAIIKAVLAENPPLHLPLGAFALEVIQKKLANLEQDFANWREVALATDYPQ